MHLYISDLDGTLLTPDAIITPYSRQTISRLIENGLRFSVATARTLATVRQILQGLALNVPVVLMNGACLFDLQQDRYVRTEEINGPAKTFLFDLLRQHDMAGFVYTVDENQLHTWYERIDTPAARYYVDERVNRYGKVFTCVKEFQHDLANRSVVYYSITDRTEKLADLHQALLQSCQLNVAFYHDVYQPGSSYLEVSALSASKYHALQTLRTMYAFDKITSFGDNYNDLPMFQASDQCLAVANALPEVKTAADEVIGSHTNDGVARWLHARMALSQKETRL